MTTRPEPSESERQALLRSLTEVGPSKPVGYLPLYTINDFVQLTPEAVAAAATARGLATGSLVPTHAASRVVRFTSMIERPSPRICKRERT
jgi:hypothetical protein